MIRHSRKTIEQKLSEFVRIKYNKFQWWRNWKLKDTLHPKRTVLERVLNGDFDHSAYYWMAQYALYELEDRQTGVQDLEKRRESESLYMEKYRRLMEDYTKDEALRLEDFKKALVKETRITRDQLEQLMETFEGTLEDLCNQVSADFGVVRQLPPQHLIKGFSLTFEEERDVEDLRLKS